jgi:hypothetical protein
MRVLLSTPGKIIEEADSLQEEQENASRSTSSHDRSPRQPGFSSRRARPGEFDDLSLPTGARVTDLGSDDSSES